MERRLTVSQENRRTESNAIQIPSISTPQGGGAIKGIDEKFSINSSNGTSSLSIPIPGDSARGFAPALSVDYNSGNGNDVFGVGWSLSLACISRKTDKGLPRYLDDVESDTFILSGLEDLVPALNPGTDGHFGDGAEFLEHRDGDYTVRRYIPRTEGSFSRIERFTHGDGTIFWKITSNTNTTTVYGASANSRLSSSDGSSTFKWFPEFSYDNKGNAIEYVYLHESKDDIDPEKVSNRNRMAGDGIQFSGIYLSEVRYGNRFPFFDGVERPKEDDYRFVTRFEYMTHRPDVFSSYRSGFEIRTSRLCTSVKSIHRFPQLPGGEAIVSSLDFSYDITKSFTFLKEVCVSGYIKHRDGHYTKKSLPATSYSYQEHTWNSEMETLDVETDSSFVFTDLYNEGIPGLLSEKEGNWYYRRNLGEGNFSKPIVIPSRPSFSGGNVNLADLDSDGRKQLVNLSFEPKGFFELGDDSQWSPMSYFPSLPSTDMDSPFTRMIDLTGDGKPDILVTEDNVFTWHESKGKGGFGSGQRVAIDWDEENGPRISFNDATQSIFLADMSGDGCADIVRVRNGEVCYWPNLGYGKFGAKITMEHSPIFSGDGQFNPTLVRFSDIDGSGPSDIIYLGNGKFECWMNHGGSALSETPYTIDAVPEISNATDINFVDLLGNGTSCMVWSDPSALKGSANIRYIDLTSGVKPHVMTGYRTGGGKEVRMEYTSSVKYYLEDTLSGNPWPEKLPFPVQCLSGVETLDLVTGHRFVTKYTYHNGYYDHAEREFRGFGLVEQTDTETFEKWSRKESSNLLNEDLHQKPVITRTWFNTGSINNPIEIEVASGVDATLISPLDNVSWREAHRVGRGTAIRQTITDDEGKLYSETRNSMVAQLVQPKGCNAHAVFMSLQKESISYSYECGDMDDPRISHSITLSYDEKGNPLETASIVYPRRKADNTLPDTIAAMQKECHISYNSTAYTNDIDKDGMYYARMPYLSESYIVENLQCGGELYSKEDFSNVKSHATLASRSLTTYYSEDFKNPSPRGILETRPIQYCNYVQAFTPDMIKSAYDGRVDDEDMVNGRYVKVDGFDGWWIPSGRAILLQDGETIEDLKRRFYNALVFETVLGAQTKIRFVDDECLFIESVEDAFGNETKALEYDYRTMSVRTIGDINGNQTATIVDELGMVMATAVMGKGDEADTLDGFGDETSAEDDALVKDFFQTEDYAKMEEIGHKLLRGASSRYVYRLDRFQEEGSPLCGALIVREQHNAVNPDSPLQISFEYTSGLGGVALAKVQAEMENNAEGVRWIGNGRTILNNKGNAVMQYEPYFSSAPFYENAKEVVERGVTPVIHYDALGRAVRTDMPDGTFTKTEFNAWKSVSYDQIDTVTGSEWLQKAYREEADKWVKDAARKSEELSSTPTTSHFDSLGRTVYVLDSDGTSSTTVFDKFGNVERVLDSKGNTVVRTTYDMLGNITSVHSMDDGSRWVFLNATGATSTTWDERGHKFDRFYDMTGRSTYSTVIGGDTEKLSNIIYKVIYGEDLLNEGYSREQLRELNYLGKAIKTYDTSGLSSVEEFDFAGRVLKASKQLAKDFKSTVNWTNENLRSGLEDEAFRSSNRYDALGRTTQVVNPDGSEIYLEFGRGSLPKSQSIKKKGEKEPKRHIKSMSFNEKRQRYRIVYGNDVSVRYTYDPLTFRINRVLTTRKNGDVIQDLNYTFDAAGHVTHMVDNAIPVEFNSNKVISGDSDYTYDMHYRLISATGRENNAALREGGINEYHDKRFCSSMAPGDPIGLRNYTEKYQYDCVGNILQMKHIASGNSWTRDYEYASDSNRLLSTRMGDDVSRYTYHPQHGFMTSMPHLTRMEWNFRDELSMSSRQVADDNTAEITYYCYDATGQRTRKVTVKGKKPNGDDIIKDERIYLGGYELYRCHSGVYTDLERTTISLADDRGHRYVMIETRNDIDDGTDKSVARYQFGNIIGSCSLELNDSADIISYEEYHPYGTTSFRAYNRSIKAAARRYRYSGMERDDETGLSYHTARYYIPWLGRWSSADPIGIDGGMNVYEYCGSNPISNSDTAGTNFWDDALDTVGEGLSQAGDVLKDTFYSAVGATAEFLHEHPRVVGTLTVVAGTVETAAGAALTSAGVALASTGVGTVPGILIAAAGGAVTAHGVDTFIAGAATVIDGNPHNTVTQDLITIKAIGFGASDETAEKIGLYSDVAIGLIGAFGSGFLLKCAGSKAKDAAIIARADISAARTEKLAQEEVLETAQREILNIKASIRESRNSVNEARLHYEEVTKMVDSTDKEMRHIGYVVNQMQQSALTRYVSEQAKLDETIFQGSQAYSKYVKADAKFYQALNRQREAMRLTRKLNDIKHFSKYNFASYSTRSVGKVVDYSTSGATPAVSTVANGTSTTSKFEPSSVLYSVVKKFSN